MTRLIFWIALVILVVWAVRAKVRAMMAPYREGAAPGSGATSGAASGAPRGRSGAGPAWRRQVRDDAESMSCCAACGIYFPSSEAVRVDGRDYCGTAHAQVPQPSLRKSPADNAG
jgi:uncharacterized protein